MMRTLQSSSPTTAGVSTRDLSYHPQKKSISSRISTQSTPPLRASKKDQTASPHLANSPMPNGLSASRATRLTNATERSKGCDKDNVATPTKAFLSSNITPRSSSRKARVDSASSTPHGTPNHTPANSRPTSMVYTNGHRFEEPLGMSGYGLNKLGNGRRSRSGSVTSNCMSSTLSFRDQSPERSMPARGATSPDSAPKFFHANEVKRNSLQKDDTRRLRTSPIAANPDSGNLVPRGIASSNSSSPSETLDKKFFHVDNLSGIKPILSKASSADPSVAAQRSSPKQKTFSPLQRSTPQRSTSPLKEFELPRKDSIYKSPPSSVSTKPRSLDHTESPSTPQIQASPRRKISLRSSTSPRVGHTKSSSVSSIGSRSNTRSNLTMTVPHTCVPPSPSQSIAAERESLLDNDATRVAAILPLPFPESSASPSLLPPRPAATKTETKLEQLNVLAANARRERKVLDLEISNSSLLAINRTLERELRKQTTELRRFRRLTSTGRISIAPSKRSLSNRNISMSTTENSNFNSDSGEDAPMSLDFLSADEDEENGSCVSHEVRSPDSQSLHDARQRAKDERRLQLDLTKHQELLIDSQRMNQSLKRCLGWTEDLLSEGRKALAYQVQVSDIEVGGRVLAPDELNRELPQRRGLLSPVGEGENNPWDFGLSEGEGGNEIDVKSPEEAVGLRAYVDSLEEGWGI